MSREWYIRTDKRHIQDTFDDIDTTPLTPQEKWQKNKGKYILWGMEALIVVALLIFAVPPLLRKNPPDYTVTVVTQDPIPTAAEKYVPSLLAPHAVDRDGDGEVEIAVRTLTIGDTEEGARNPSLELLIASFYTDEFTLFAMTPEVYKAYVAAYTQEGVSLFDTLHTTTVADSNGTLFATEKNEHLPAFWWGVRALPNAKDDAKQNANAHKTVLESFANNRQG